MKTLRRPQTGPESPADAHDDELISSNFWSGQNHRRTSPESAKKKIKQPGRVQNGSEKSRNGADKLLVLGPAAASSAIEQDARNL